MAEARKEESIEKLRKQAGKRYIKVRKNTKNGWFEVMIPNLPISEAEKGKLIDYLFDVDLPGDAENEESNIINLQYFFVRTEYELRKKHENGENACFNLLVRVKKKEDLYRVESYLYLQSCLRVNMRFYVAYEDKCYKVRTEATALGRVPPLICVARRKAESDESSGRDGFYSYYQLAEVERLTRAAVELCAQIVSEDRKGEEKAKLLNKRFAPFQRICAEYLIEAFDVKGTTEHSITKARKLELIKELCDCVLEKEPENATPVSLLIWFVYLRYMQENKELLHWSDAENRYIVWKERLDKSFLDAREYADGLLQLLENSCQHTENAVAYLSIRVHYIDRNCRESDLVAVAETRSRLINRYSVSLMELNNEKFCVFPRRFAIDENAMYYLELHVTDDATYRENGVVSARGISAMHAKNRKLEGDVELCNVFGHTFAEERDELEKEELSERKLKNVTYHYGVRQLQKIVLRNGGVFMVSSPGMEQDNRREIYSAYYEKSLPKSHETVPGEKRIIADKLTQRRGIGWQQLQVYDTLSFYSTEYQILLPMGGRRQGRKEKEHLAVIPPEQPLQERGMLAGDSFESSEKLELRLLLNEWLNDEKLLADIPFGLDDEKGNVSKIRVTESIKNKLKETLSQDEANSLTIHVLDYSNLNFSMVEYAAKALFLIIGEKRMEQEKGEGQLYAVCFNNLHHMQEFVLCYSVFYDEYGKNPFMENVQIAVCSRKEGCVPEVNFILAGTDLDSAWQTADVFTYHSASDTTLAMLPQLQYLCYKPFEENKNPKGKPLAPFPFDLYLNEAHYPAPISGIIGEKKETSEAKSDVKPAALYDCWFMRRMTEIIETDLREESFGCKIDNVHVRLASKMHIERFYEAELLFQNVNIVVRFAYLIARDILGDRETKKSFLLVGYETNSTVILEYVVKFLSYSGVKADYGIFVRESSGKTQFYPSAALAAENKTWKEEKKKLVSVYPIGTTMSTVYHMIEHIPPELHVNPWRNFCVLAVDDKTEGGELRPKYWTHKGEGVSPNRTLLERSTMCLRDNGYHSKPVEIRFFMEAKTYWHDPETCICSSPSQEKVLTYVDRTSTVPDTVFPLRGRKNDGPERFLKDNRAVKNNDERLEKLRECVCFGHITQGHNHFLYHINLPKYFEIVRDEVATEAAKWAETIDAEAFNIIVTPLELNNAAFLQTVVENVFAHSMRIVRIPFLEATKEDVRAKYSALTDEYRRIRTANPDAEINLYFVTLSMVMGETFWRATKLLTMLLEDSGCYLPSAHLFKGVFMLVNRSSFSTVQTMVENPERDFHAFLYLSVPHFNSYKGECPLCARRRADEYLLKNCATNTTTKGFGRQVKKHEIRSPQEHQEWLSEELWGSPKSFSRLCVWLYLNVKYDSDQWLIDLRDNCLDIIGKSDRPVRLYEHKKELGQTEKQLEELWRTNIRGEHAYLRLVCTHRAFCALEKGALLSCDSESLTQESIKVILDELLIKIPKDDSIPYIEWLISYIKVLSRDYLSKYNYISEAVFSIMVCLLVFLLGSKAEKPQIITPDIANKLSGITKKCNGEKVLPVQRYQFIMMLYHQLAKMQANIVLNDAFLEKLSEYLQELKKQQELSETADNYMKLCRLPPDEQLEREYVRCVKLCLLSGDEENKSLLLRTETESSLKGGAE